MKKSLIVAIKKLFTKLGAENIEGNNLVEVIDKGADALNSGGGSGGGVFVVTCEVSIVDEQPVFGLASKGALDIIEAVNKYLLPVLFIHDTSPGIGNAVADEIMIYYSASNVPSGVAVQFAPIKSTSNVSLFIEADGSIILGYE